jgi:catechol 2,3-dioxygenase-like lactoylglutathione lyase family enzyme
MRVRGIDHLVLVVADTDRSVAWYRDRLGLAPERYDEWKAGSVLFASLRVDPHTVIDLLEGERTGQNVDHVCLVVEGLDLDAAATSGEWAVHGGPAEVWGAQGVGRSLYVKDPDDNVIELRVYP